ncbi:MULTISPECIES: helix-turn-helix transcriptional regulator [Aequorivita]|uniref:Fumarate hydratase n=1 Tax=Aequorivita iocasae TaxID=2803865 RepID=A0ABX7DQ03_9FLAO|nr:MULTISPECIES: fumarate hydratase [Aequorivita]QQX75882.1 fumarate hydratase [Aequorivita iocasae]UCA55344.1 fumarate hydratase [Aequorivita sp. F7]
MTYSVISGDIVSSTGLHIQDRKLVEEYLNILLQNLKKEFNVYGRIIKGDYLECVVPNASQGLQVALAIKSFVKAIPIQMKTYKSEDNRIKQFKTHGIRLAIGYGKLSRYKPEEGIIDGEAIYLSGREISGETTYNKERIVIKNTLFFASKNEDFNKNFQPLLALLDVLLSKATARQCEVLYLKLMNNQEDEIAKRLGIGQSAVNQHSTSVGWNAIEEAVNYYKMVISK